MWKIILISTAMLLLTLAGCSGTYNEPSFSEQPNRISKQKVRGEAYLFDARLRRQGKPTSFRLELYRYGDITALSGRGYLGKGALKGVIKNDTILVYFPTTHEYVEETIGSIIASTPCPEGIPYLNVMKLLSTLPDSLQDFEHVEVTANYLNSKRPEFIIYSRGCPWQLTLVYDHKKTGWRLRHFVFDDGEGNILKARRREYKPNARIPLKRFTINIPPEASRIIP